MLHHLIVSIPAACELRLVAFLSLIATDLAAWQWLPNFTRPLTPTLVEVAYMSLP